VRFTWLEWRLPPRRVLARRSFTNVSHGCVNMPPADAEIYYEMAVPGDPVTITGSPGRRLRQSVFLSAQLRCAVRIAAITATERNEVFP
jgi:L,D-transpeptidase catalytic domain